jgi:GTP-binding protein EngB required for normal cell division
MFYNLQNKKCEIIIVANKIDKLKKSEFEKQMKEIKKVFDGHLVIPCSAFKKTGMSDLSGVLLQ